MALKDKMMDRMIGNMSKEEKAEMMDKMMEKFFEDFTPEEKQQLMLKMMPKMMQDVDFAQLMPQMMMTMMGGMMGGMGGGPMGGGPMGDWTAAGPTGDRAPSAPVSRRATMMKGYDDDPGAATAAGEAREGAGPSGISAPGPKAGGAARAPMPFDMCKGMVEALRSISEVNKELLEELRRR